MAVASSRSRGKLGLEASTAQTTFYFSRISGVLFTRCVNEAPTQKLDCGVLGLEAPVTIRKRHISTSPETSEDPQARSPSSGSFIHLFVMAIIAGLAVIVLIKIIDEQGPRRYLGACCVSVFISLACASMFVVAAWSVFGVGAYWVRTLWAHLGGACVGLGYLVGLCLVFSNGPGSWANFWDTTDTTYLVILMIPPLSLAAQMPLWCFRVFFGWQFVFEDSPPAEAFTLRDIFVITFGCALALATMQLAGNLLESWSGSREWLTLLGFYALAASGISLLCLPALTIAFWSKEFGVACFSVTIYAILWFVVLIMTVAALSSNVPPFEVLVGMAVLLGSFVALISIPFMVSKANGFHLTTARRYQKTQQRASE